MPPPRPRRRRPGSSAWCRVGEGEEHLVQAGLAEGEVVDGDAGRGPARPAPGRPARRPAVVGPAPPTRAVSATGSGSSCTARRARGAAPARPRGRCAGVAQPQVDGAGAHRRLQLALRALGDHLAVVDDRDAGGQLVGLVQVLGGQQHGGALGDHRPHDVPHLVAAARVEAGRRLVEEQQLGRVEDARGDVDTAPHAARVVLDLAVRPPRSARRPPAAARPARARPACAWPSSRPSRTRFSVPVRSSSTEAYCPVRLTRPRTASASRTTSWPKTRASPAVGAQQGGEHPHRGGLAGAVRAEHAVDRAGGHGQVDAVHRPGVAERLDQARGLDGEAGCRVAHGSSLRCRASSDLNLEAREGGRGPLHSI